MIGPDSVIAPDVDLIVEAAVNSTGIEQVDADAFELIIAPEVLPVPAIFILPQLDNVWAFKSKIPPDCTSM